MKNTKLEFLGEKLIEKWIAGSLSYQDETINFYEGNV